MADKALNLMGMMRRASAIEIGETNTGTAVRNGKAKLLVLASDASDNARRRADGFCFGRNVSRVELPYRKEELSAALGIPGCSMAAITDMGFANALMKLLREINETLYAGAAEEIAARFDRVQRNRSEGSSDEGRSRRRKRRNDA